MAKQKNCRLGVSALHQHKRAAPVRSLLGGTCLNGSHARAVTQCSIRCRINQAATRFQEPFAGKWAAATSPLSTAGLCDCNSFSGGALPCISWECQGMQSGAVLQAPWDSGAASHGIG